MLSKVELIRAIPIQKNSNQEMFLLSVYSRFVKTEGIESLLTESDDYEPREYQATFSHPVQRAMANFSMRNRNDEIGAYLIERLGLTPPGVQNPNSVANILAQATDVHPWIYSWLHSMQAYDGFQEALPRIASAFPVQRDVTDMKAELSLNQIEWFLDQEMFKQKDTQYRVMLEQARTAIEARNWANLGPVIDSARVKYRSEENGDLWVAARSLAYIDSENSYGVPHRKTSEKLQGWEVLFQGQARVFVQHCEEPA